MHIAAAKGKIDFDPSAQSARAGREEREEGRQRRSAGSDFFVLSVFRLFSARQTEKEAGNAGI